MKAFLKIIGVMFGLLILFIAGIAFLLKDFVHPVDPSYYHIKLLKTGKIDTLVTFNVQVAPGDTIMVAYTGSEYADTTDILSTTGKVKKAVVVDGNVSIPDPYAPTSSSE